jgi:hypothetical protein
VPDIREFTTSKWLNAADPIFDSGPVVATIKIVDEQELPARMGRGAEAKLCIHWHEEVIRPYLCNRMNLKVAGAKLGTDTDGWRGAKIRMETQPTQRPDGSMTQGIRFIGVKPPASPAKQASAPPISQAPQTAAEGDWGDAPVSGKANDLDDQIPF